MVTSNFDKFRLLLWKNWILQWNHKFQLIVELLLPVIFAMLLVMVRRLVPATPSEAIVYNRSFPLDTLDLLSRRMYQIGLLNSFKYHLAYSPNTSRVFDSIVKEAAYKLSVSYSGYATATEMAHTVANFKFLAGVEFEDSLANISKYPEQLNYRIRFPSELRTSTSIVLQTWFTNTMFFPMLPPGPRNKNIMDGGNPVGYLREGFLPIQHAISTAFIRQSAKNRRQALPRVYLQRYPFPAYIDDPLLAGLAALMGLIILLSYIYPATYTVKSITWEKEKQLKEVMKIMGLQNWLHWTAWFVKAFLMMGFSSLLITIVLMIKWRDNVAVLTYSSFTAVYFFLLVYTMTSITFCFMLATFFSKATTAAAVTGLIWFITYIPFTFFQLNYDHLTLGTKLYSSLISNTAMGFGIRAIVAFEMDGIGLQWSNMFTPLSIDDTLVLADVLGMMCIASFIHMIIALYMEQIFPGEFGVPKKWNFPFTKSFWCGDREYVGMVTSRSTIQIKPSAFEVEPIGPDLGVQVKNLSKSFGEKKAVNGLSLNMYEDEITVLLGHNGAGKTTTISMLTGMIPPSTGTAIVNGCDIRTNIDGARMSLGLCPQHNILFDDLTVRDHLVFYSRLKGFKSAELEAEVKKYIEKIDLENKANVASSKLSGGMKRKLSVCAAFCGGTKVVLCDEPSSGMDPAARRQLWDLLQSEKIGRTVLLTTHFMDEADVLGDRIAIMCAGELKCIGTSFFLKKKFGSGYHLICEKKDNCDSAEVTRLLSKYVPDLQPEAEIGAELSYRLPDKYSANFETMFQDLEKHSDQLNLNGYGVSIASLEEVFMNVGAENSNGGVDASPKATTNGNASESVDKESMSSANMFTDKERLLKGWNLMLSQWRSMILKKYIFTIRNKLLFAIQNIMPILFIALTIFVSTLSLLSTLKPMRMGLFQYPETVTVLETRSNVKEGSLEAKISESYKKIVESFGPNHKITIISIKFIDYIVGLGRKMQHRINTKYIAAATVKRGRIIAWLNNQPIHAGPVTLNMIHNAMAKVVIGPKASIHVTNAPLSYSRRSEIEILKSGKSLGTQVALNLCFCMCFVSALYVMFLIKEHESRAKLLQFVGGIRVLTFWLSHYVWDMFTYTITSAIVIITFACFQEEGYSTVDELGRNFALLLIFGLSVLPFTYFMAALFSEPSTGFARLAIINIFFGNALFVLVLIMSFDMFITKEIAERLEVFCLAFPHFALAQGLNRLYFNTQLKKICQPIVDAVPAEIRCSLMPQCCNDTPFFAWEKPGVLREIIYLTITAIVFFLGLILKEYRFMDCIWFKIKERTTRPPPPPPPEDGYYDEDVESEKVKIQNMSSSEISSQNLVLDKITKFYGRYVAVNQISVAIKQSECFGLLGVNGAGKTSTFKMLTGDERISSGDAYVKGLSLKKDMNQVYQEIGYCPQFDAVLDDFTGREMLQIFSLIRGIPKAMIPQVCSVYATSFGFMQHYNKQVRAYSGGTKRKLSTALAVVGNPSVVYLDEPTTGMDPVARRQLWNMLCKVRNAGKSIVLTSHSMEECEALCTRLAIMVNGEFKCLGSIQHLKNKFTKGFILKIKLNKDIHLTRSKSVHNFEEDKSVGMNRMEEDITNVIELIHKEFPEAVLQEQFQRLLTFYIPITGILWSKIFGLMEKNKIINIEDYSISQTTLEEIFLQFAKYQREDPREVKHPPGFCKAFVMCVRAKL